MSRSKPEEAKPFIRFPGFQKPWTRIALGEHLVKHGERVSNDTKLPIYSSTRDGLVRQDDYYGGNNLENKNEYGIVPPNYFVYRHMSDDGRFKFNINETGHDIAVSREYPVFKAKDLEPIFLLAKLNYGFDFQRFALSQKAGGTRTRLYLSKLKEWETLLPCPEEQKKIADCLGSLDELISAQSRKLDALVKHKKGLMQQLFPREGETVPRLRFPEFRDEGEWNFDPLSQIVENLDSQRVPITENDRIPGSNPYYGASGIVDHVDGYLFDENLLCVSEDGANLIARTYPIAFSITGKTWVNNHAHVLRFATEATQKMVEDYLNSTSIRDFVTGMAQPKLNKANLNMIPVPLPKPNEQNRIASCLSSVDSQITAETQKLESLKTHKKGLMQQLFPMPEEM